MAAPIVYRSTDAAAPVLTGQAGSLIAVLDACLVNGYTGKAAAGWTKAFAGTNAASYRQGSGPLFYVDVGDNGAGTGSFKEARFAVYDAMTAVATGSNKTPSSTSYFICRKSMTLDATARAWLIVADSATVYLFTKGVIDDATVWSGLAFGDFIPTAPSDPNRMIIIGRTLENNSGTTVETIADQGLVSDALSGHRLLKDLAGTTDRNMNKSGDLALAWRPASFPNLYDNAVYVAPVLIGEQSGSILRGRLRGFWQLCNSPTGVVADGDTFDAGGEYAGRSFMFVNCAPASGDLSVLIELTDWSL